jgi:hypothetical protein
VSLRTRAHNFSVAQERFGVTSKRRQCSCRVCQSDFARRHYGQGEAEGWAKGKAEGRMELILKLLALRFGALPDAIQTGVRSAQDAQLDAVAERMLTAKTLEEAASRLF